MYTFLQPFKKMKESFHIEAPVAKVFIGSSVVLQLISGISEYYAIHTYVSKIANVAVAISIGLLIAYIMEMGLRNATFYAAEAILYFWIGWPEDFDEEKAGAAIQKHKLSRDMIEVWREKGRMPAKYFRTDISQADLWLSNIMILFSLSFIAVFVTFSCFASKRGLQYALKDQTPTPVLVPSAKIEAEYNQEIARLQGLRDEGIRMQTELFDKQVAANNDKYAADIEKYQTYEQTRDQRYTSAIARNKKKLAEGAAGLEKAKMEALNRHETEYNIGVKAAKADRDKALGIIKKKNDGIESDSEAYTKFFTFVSTAIVVGASPLSLLLIVFFCIFQFKNEIKRRVKPSAEYFEGGIIGFIRELLMLIEVWTIRLVRNKVRVGISHAPVLIQMDYNNMGTVFPDVEEFIAEEQSSSTKAGSPPSTSPSTPAAEPDVEGELPTKTTGRKLVLTKEAFKMKRRDDVPTSSTSSTRKNPDRIEEKGEEKTEEAETVELKIRTVKEKQLNTVTRINGEPIVEIDGQQRNQSWVRKQLQQRMGFLLSETRSEATNWELLEVYAKALGLLDAFGETSANYDWAKSYFDRKLTEFPLQKQSPYRKKCDNLINLIETTKKTVA